MQRRGHMWTWSRNAVIFSRKKNLRYIQVWNSFWKLWRLHPPHLRWEGTSSLLSVLGSKAHISDGMGCISAYDMGSLHICKRHHQCWKAYTGFTATYAPFQAMSISEKALHFSARQCYCILKLLLLLLLLRQHGFVVEKSGCWTGRLAIWIFHQLKTFGASWNKKYDKEGSGLLSSWNPIWERNGTTFPSPNSNDWSPQLPDVYEVLLEEERMLHRDETWLSPNVLKTCCRHQIQDYFIS